MESQLAEVKRRAAPLVDQVADGVLTGAAVKDRPDALESRRSELEAELESTSVAPVVALHPRMPSATRAWSPCLSAPWIAAALEARDLVRKLIETVVVTPSPERGKFALTVKGKIAALVVQDGDDTTVLGARARSGRYLTPQLIFAA